MALGNGSGGTSANGDLKNSVATNGEKIGTGTDGVIPHKVPRQVCVFLHPDSCYCSGITTLLSKILSTQFTGNS